MGWCALDGLCGNSIEWIYAGRKAKMNIQFKNMIADTIVTIAFKISSFGGQSIRRLHRNYGFEHYLIQQLGCLLRGLDSKVPNPEIGQQQGLRAVRASGSGGSVTGIML